MGQAHVWCRSISHEQHHAIIDGAPVCVTAKIGLWESWVIVKTDEMDQTKQCCRCKGAVSRLSEAALFEPSKLADFFREIGRKGGKASTPAKARAARLRERSKAKHKRLVVVRNY